MRIASLRSSIPFRAHAFLAFARDYSLSRFRFAASDLCFGPIFRRCAGNGLKTLPTFGRSSISVVFDLDLLKPPLRYFSNYYAQRAILWQTYSLSCTY